MSLKPFKKIKKSSGDVQKDLALVQDNIAEAFAPIVKKPSLDRSVIENVSLVAGQKNSVNHSLGRELQGWNTCRIKSQQTVVWDDQDNNLTPEKTLILLCASDCVVSIEVF